MAVLDILLYNILIMYKAEGVYSYRQRPETLIGDFGIAAALQVPDDHSAPTVSNEAHWTVGTEVSTRSYTERFQKEGSLPLELEIEEITTVEQAVKFAIVRHRPLKISRPWAPDVGKLVERRVLKALKTHELLAADVSVTKAGEFVERRGFNPEDGWHNLSQAIQAPADAITIQGEPALEQA